MCQNLESFLPEREWRGLRKDFSDPCLRQLVTTISSAAREYLASSDISSSRSRNVDEFSMKMLRLVTGAAYTLQNERPRSMRDGQIEDLMCRAVHVVTRNASTYHKTNGASKPFEEHVADFVHHQLFLAMKMLKCQQKDE